MKRRHLAIAATLLSACGSGEGTQASDARESDAREIDATIVHDAASIDASSAKELTAIAFLASENPALSTDATAAIVDATAVASVPFRTDRSSLIATFTSTGVRVEVDGVEQQSGVTANDLSAPVSYRVFADDGSFADYLVQVSGGQEAYVKASNTGVGDLFGMSVALSGDGNTLAMGAFEEDSSATGVDGVQADESAGSSGAVYVFARIGTTWSQQAYVKASNTGGGDGFGYHLAISDDGNTLAVSAAFEKSAATGIDGNQLDNSADWAGAVYVLTRSDTTWTQQAYVKASNTTQGAVFGEGLALSGDGNTLAVGARNEDSAATGIDGDQTSTSADASGAVYVFTRTGTSWQQQAYVKASNTDPGDWFGFSVALSGNGDTLAVGANLENSSAVGLDGNQAGNSAPDAGAVYVFSRSGALWSQEAYVKASNTGSGDEFGRSVTLSSDGNTLAVGAFGEDSSATGIDGDQLSSGASDSGAVYVFSRSGATWTQEAYVKASNTKAGNAFSTVALSGDGSTLAVGAMYENSAATGVAGVQDDSSAGSSGAVYLFTRAGSSWRQQLYVKASNTGANDGFGDGVRLSSDGSTMAVAAWLEDSPATGINGNEYDLAWDSGAAYVFH